MDTKTRWNSTLDMVKRVIELEECIDSALRMCGKESLALTKEEWNTLKNLCAALRPFEFIIKGMSTEDGTLVKSEKSMQFLVNELNLQKTDISKQFLDGINSRYASQRLTDFVSLMLFLEDPKSIKNSKSFA